MRRFLTIAAGAALAACAATQPGVDDSAPFLSLGVIDHEHEPLYARASGPMEVRLERLELVHLEAWGEDVQSGVAATRLRAELRVVCRQADGGTMVRQVVRERDNSERDRPPRRTAAIDVNLPREIDGLCRGGRYESGEILVTASVVNGAGLESRSETLRVILPEGNA